MSEFRKIRTVPVYDATPDDHLGRKGDITYKSGTLYYHDGVTPGGDAIATGGGGSADTGNITFEGDYISSPDGVVRLRSLDTTTTASYSFTPGGGDYSTAVWNNNGITFNDPTQEVYTAIWALTSLSTIEIQINGVWQTVTSNGSSTPGWPAAPTLWLEQSAVNGPVNIDIVEMTIRDGTESYVEIDGSDFRVDVQDDVRIYGNDTFRLVNRSEDSSISIITDDDDDSHSWNFRPDGHLDLPDNGDIFQNGTSVLKNTRGCFHKLASMTADSADTAYSFDWYNNTHVHASQGVSVDSSEPTRVYITSRGNFMVNLEMLIKVTGNGSHVVYLWLAKNGIDIPETGVKISSRTGTVSNPSYETLAKQWFLDNIDGSDYIELRFALNQVTDIELEYTPEQTVPYNRPALPSAVLTITQV